MYIAKKQYLCTRFLGKLSEWSKEPHSKCGVRITSYRGFESLTFRYGHVVCVKRLDFTDKYAFVTGASSGMGYCYARRLAERGYNLLIVSNEETINGKATILRQDYNVQVISIVRDLSLQDAAKELYAYCIQHQIEVEVLVNNAGVYHDRDFLDDTEMFNSLIINLHTFTPAMLCYYFGQDMAKRGKGYILNVCSVTSRIAVQRLSTYAATKAFLESFTRSLYIELRDKGVCVTNISPGAVDTGLYHISPLATKIGKTFGYIVSPDYLVKRALRGLFRGQSKVSVPCIWNALLTLLVSIIPTSALRLIRHLRWF